MKKASYNVIYLAVFIDLVGFGVVIPLLPYLVNKMGASGLFATSLLAIFSLMQFVFAPILGRLSDRYGRRPLMLLCLFGSVVSYVIYGCAPLISHTAAITLWIIFISRMFAGIMGGNIAIAYAYIADVTVPEKRTAALGKIGAAFGMGFILGPAIGGLLESWGPSAPGFCAAALSLLSFLVALKALPESKIDQTASASSSKSTRLMGIKKIALYKYCGVIIFTSFIYSLAFTQMESIFSLFAGKAYHLSQLHIGWSFVYFGVLIAGVQGLLVGKISKICGDLNMAIIGVCLIGIAFLGVSESHSFLVMMAFMSCVPFGAGVINPALTSILSRNVHSSDQGLIQGVNQSASSLARVIGPLIAGFLFDTHLPTTPFLFGGSLMFAAACVMVWLKLATDRVATPASDLGV